MTKTQFIKVKKLVKNCMEQRAMEQDWNDMQDFKYVKEIFDYYYKNNGLETEKERKQSGIKSFQKMHKILKGKKVYDEYDY